ncbi:26 kDa periplasmic immunogenic protein precursor [Falsiruegeria litorea R37]|uniref:26 kDa periplasmic immunogenic protein n=1 Tax=Falsiruegeria litorea R37 TaxID=1200284 RepID=A0A1Y5SSL7_9RHOB|nr:SIMPL domain-containing protein [Falsiruegeria litorea]SLN47467.1 26 kDa periplasmic immunogenic protein precursor [Falsiruegeria litorea R37]
MKTLVFLVTALMLTAATLVRAEEQPRTIQVSGQAQVQAVPDQALINLGVTNEATTAAEAMDATSQALAAVIERLKAQGIEARDIQTQQLSLHPIWSQKIDKATGQNRNHVTGYSASNILAVRVVDLDKLGVILGEVVGNGANEFQGLSFSVQDPKPLIDQARTAAVKDAMDRAAQLADSAGIKLGNVMTISENSVQPYARGANARFAAMESAPVPIEAGEISYQSSVSMVFAIGE